MAVRCGHTRKKKSLKKCLILIVQIFVLLALCEWLISMGICMKKSVFFFYSVVLSLAFWCNFCKEDTLFYVG